MMLNREISERDSTMRQDCQMAGAHTTLLLVEPRTLSGKKHCPWMKNIKLICEGRCFCRSHIRLYNSSPTAGGGPRPHRPPQVGQEVLPDRARRLHRPVSGPLRLRALSACRLCRACKV